MAHSKKRSRAHAAAITCLVQECLSFAVLFVCLFVWLLDSEEVVRKITTARDTRNKEYIAGATLTKDTTIKNTEDNMVSTFIWAMFVLAFICELVKAWAAFLLFKATGIMETEISVLLKLKYCRIWKLVTSVFFILLVLSLFAYTFTMYVVVIALICLMEGLFLYIVGSFTAELRTSRGDISSTCSFA